MSVQSGLVIFAADLTPLLVDIDTVEQHPENYNNGDLDAIIESIEINGMYRPIYVQRSTNYIFAGNHVWEACKHLEARQIPAVFADVDDDTALRIMLADNRIAALGRPDNAALVKILDRLAETDSLMGTGFTPADHEVLKALVDMPLNYDDYAQWPSLCFQVPPHVKAEFQKMTEHAGGDREKFELLLRLAGWDGKKHT